MRTCTSCRKEKPIEAFHFHAKCSDGRLSQCRECRNTYLSQWRKQHTDGPAAARGLSPEARRRKQKKRYDRAALFIEQQKQRPCADCSGEFPSVCMDFDHVRGDKRFDIAASKRLSLHTIAEEIAKCELVCANCHRIRTAARK